MDLETMEAADLRDMGEANLRRVVRRVGAELETLPEPGIPHRPDIVRANHMSVLLRAAEARMGEIDAAIPKPTDEWDAQRAEAWAWQYREARAKYEQDLKHRENYLEGVITDEIGQRPLGGTERQRWDARAAELRVKHEGRAPKIVHPEPGLPESIKHPSEYEAFRNAVASLMSNSGPYQEFAVRFVQEMPAKIAADAAERGVDVPAGLYEYERRNPDDVRAAREITAMHPSEAGGLFDGADPNAERGLPGITKISGEASLDAWLDWVASHPSVLERVKPHIGDVLAEAEARGWIARTDRVLGGLPVYKCHGSGMTLGVPPALYPVGDDLPPWVQ